MRAAIERVDHLDEREAVEVGVARVDAANSVLAHEDGGMSIVKNVSAQMRRFCNYFAQDIGMSRSR